MNILKRKKIYFLISLIVMIPGLISLALWGLNLSIEFTGGSRMTVTFPREVTVEQRDFLRNSLEEKEIKVSSIETSNKLAIIRTEEMD